VVKQSSPQELGYQFEETFAKALGVKPQKGSGSHWTARMDVADGEILWSLKKTTNESFRLTKGLISEVVSAVFGMGGVGPSTTPGVAVDVDGEVLVILRAADFRRMVLQDRVQYMPQTKDEIRRSSARIPALLRDPEAASA
jgi:hypothetical protein